MIHHNSHHRQFTIIAMSKYPLGKIGTLIKVELVNMDMVQLILFQLLNNKLLQKNT